MPKYINDMRPHGTSKMPELRSKRPTTARKIEIEETLEENPETLPSRDQKWAAELENFTINDNNQKSQNFDFEIEDEENKQETMPEEKKTKKAKKSPGKFLNFLSKFFFAIFALATAAVLILLLAVNILPLKYLAILLGIAAVFLLVFGIFTFRKKSQKPAKITCSIFEFIFTIILVFGFIYLNNTVNFFDAIKAGGYQTEEYQVLVLQSSSYETVESLAGLTNGTYLDIFPAYDEATEKLKEVINFQTSVQDNYFAASQALLNGNVDFILLSSSYISILDDTIENFSEKTRSVYTIEIKTYFESSFKDVDVSKEPFNILISGIDTMGDISTVSRSDVNMIVTVNPKTHKVLLTSIPRDYFVQLHGTTGNKDKLTHSGIYGINMTAKTIEDLLDINFNYYARVNFTSVVDLVNAIGGIDLYSDTYFTASDRNVGYSCVFYAGSTVHVDGGCALAFSRERHAYETGDVHRVQNQQQVMTAIMNKLMSPAIITNYSSVLNAVSDDFETNLDSARIYQLIRLQLDEMPSWQIESYNLDGEGTYDFVYSMGDAYGNWGNNKLYVMIPDESTVETAKSKIQSIMNDK